MPEVDVLVGQVVPAIGAAIGAYGADVLARLESDAATASASLGERLLARIWRRASDREHVGKAVIQLASSDLNGEAAQLFAEVLRQLIANDAELRADLAGLMRSDSSSAPGVAVQGGVTVTADNSSAAAVVIHGGVHFGGPTPPITN